ncbi:MAG: cytochrome c biogenesis protein CcsA [Deltaproteobacteria bacterium]|nr:cytochrome c biogenesis protein CcsA [Deltaproteobacteria bacterium]
MDVTFFYTALGVYLISAVGYVASILTRRVWVAKLSTWIMGAAFGVHFISFAFRYLATGHNPVVSIYDTLSLLAWILSGVYLVLQLKTKTRVLGAFVAPVTFLLMIAASYRMAGPVAIPPILRGGLVPFHVILSVTGEALFVLASLAGAMYLMQDHLIKNKKVTSFTRFLPSLKELDRINHICLLWGFPLLTLGVLAGSVWARTAWGSHWQWDPKQIWTVLVWLIYAVLLHQRLAIGWKGHKAALYSILAFLVLMVSFCIEAFFFETVHNFI